MESEMDLVMPVERAIGLLSKMDLDFFDVTATYSRSLSIGVLGKGIKDTSSLDDLGIGVRAFKNRGRGIAFSQSLDPADVETTARKAVAFAKMAQPDPYFKGMPGPSKAPEVTGLFDDEIRSLDLERAAKFVKAMIDATEGVRVGAKFSGGMSTGYWRSYLMTSTGVSFGEEKTHIGAYLSPTYREVDDVGSSYEYDYAISLGEIDFHKIGKRAAEKAVGQFGSRKVESDILPIIISPDSSGSLCSGLLDAISGESAVKGRTFASNCLGKQVAPEMFGIRDDGTIKGAVESSTYDGEGIPRRPTEVVGDGRIMTLLHNSYSAGIAGVETTGHAQRGGYGGYVGAGPTNIRVKAGDRSLDEMVAETKRGILVEQAGFFPNMVSGELSSTIDEGFLIEDGERRHPVKNLMVGGYMLDLYRNIEAVSKEGRELGKGHFFPAIKIDGVKIAGK